LTLSVTHIWCSRRDNDVADWDCVQMSSTIYIYITSVLINNQCNIWPKFRVSLSISAVKDLPIVESSNDIILRVVCICFNANQFRAIVRPRQRSHAVLAVSGEVVPNAPSHRTRQWWSRLTIWEGSRPMRTTTYNSVSQQRNLSRRQQSQNMEMSVTGGVLGGGGLELREAISYVLLKSLLLQNYPCHVIFLSHW